MDRKISEQKLNIEFVKEVEHYPCLYDYRRLDYARKDVIEKAWAKIGTKFNISGPQCRERWKNLRTVLSRNLRPNEGTGRSRSTKQQRKPYYLYEAMKFAVPFIKSHNTVPSYFRPRHVSNSPSDQDETSEDNGDSEEPVKEAICHVKVENLNYMPSRSPSPEFTSPLLAHQVNLVEAPSPTPSSPPPPPPAQPAIRRSRRNRKNSAESRLDGNSSKNVKTKKNIIQTKPDLSKISKKRFLLSLLPDVYSMDNVQMRSFRVKILQLINEITETPSSQCTCANASNRINQATNQTNQINQLNPTDQLNHTKQKLDQTYDSINLINPIQTTVVVKIENED